MCKFPSNIRWRCAGIEPHNHIYCVLQNPLSQLGILLLRNGVAERLTDLSGSPEAQLRRLDAANLSECSFSTAYVLHKSLERFEWLP